MGCSRAIVFVVEPGLGVDPKIRDAAEDGKVAPAGFAPVGVCAGIERRLAERTAQFSESDLSPRRLGFVHRRANHGMGIRHEQFRSRTFDGSEADLK